MTRTMERLAKLNKTGMPVLVSPTVCDRCNEEDWRPITHSGDSVAAHINQIEDLLATYQRMGEPHELRKVVHCEDCRYCVEIGVNEYRSPETRHCSLLRGQNREVRDNESKSVHHLSVVILYDYCSIGEERTSIESVDKHNAPELLEPPITTEKCNVCGSSLTHCEVEYYGNTCERCESDSMRNLW